jgi:hypothetical protein
VAAIIKGNEIQWMDVVRIRFGFTGLDEAQAIPIIRRLLSDQWPELKRPKQCTYVIRLRGEVAVSYGERHSPVIYVGEGNAFNRLYSHAQWISSLLLSVPRAEIEVYVAQISRRNNKNLYKFIEADMIRWFREEYGYLPWFNRQSEGSKEGAYTYDDAATKELRRNLLIGSGSHFLWAIRPTHNNRQFGPYDCGTPERKGVRDNF